MPKQTLLFPRAATNNALAGSKQTPRHTRPAATPQHAFSPSHRAPRIAAPTPANSNGRFFSPYLYSNPLAWRHDSSTPDWEFLLHLYNDLHGNSPKTCAQSHAFLLNLYGNLPTRRTLPTSHMTLFLLILYTSPPPSTHQGESPRHGRANPSRRARDAKGMVGQIFLI